MSLIQFDSKLSKQPDSNARLRDKWTSFSVLSQRGLTVLGGITKDVSIGGRGWQGNGSTKGAYVNASMSIAAAGGSETDSLLIGVIFSSTVTTDGTLASFGVSTNTTGGHFQITHSGGALLVAADDAANVSGLSSVATSGFNDGLVHTAVALLRTRSDGRYQGLWVDGKLFASGTSGGFTKTTFDRIAVACLRRNATSNFLPAGRYVYEAFYGKGFSADEAQNLSARRWDAFYAPKRIWVPVSAGGGGTYNVTLAESTAAADALGAVGSVVAFVAEAAAASELASTVGTVAAAVSESAAAAETLAAVAAVAAALTDPATVADLVAATMVAQAAVAEALAAADVVSAGPQVSGAMAEAATAADALTVTASLVAQVAEAASAADAAATAQQLLALITEASTVADQVSGAAPAAYSVTLAEVAAALDVITAALTGTTVWPLLAARGVSAHGHGSARPEQLSTATRSNTQ